MPSGAKKRKAAKKKKQIEANTTSTNSTTHPLGDVGEASSHAARGQHNHQQPFAEGEKERVEKKEGTSSVRSFASGSKTLEGVHSSEAEAGNGIARVEEGTSVIQIDSSEYAKEMNDGSSSSSKEGGSSSYSSSSSSDDESHVVEKNIRVVESLVNPISEEEVQVTNSLSVTKVASVVDDKSSFADDVVQSDMASVVVELDSAKYGAKVVPLMTESSGGSLVLAGLKSPEKEDKVVSRTENGSGSSTFMGSAEPKNEDNLLLSYNAPRVDAVNGADHVKDPETPEYSDSQPLVPSASRTVHVTPWMSCCGLFEVFSGSSR